jgi:ubiquinone/menaquinone biosynthesis C-methylase UbiE
MPTINDVREFWDEHICGDVFTSLTERTSREYLEEVRRNRYHYEYHLLPFLRRVAAAGSPLLEIGCSMGMDLAELARMGAQVTGVDLSPKSIEVARRHFDMKGLSADLRVANAEHLDFPDASFATVYSFGVLHHTPNLSRALDEVYRVLKPGGRAFLMLYSRYSLNNFVHVLLRLPYESPRDWKIDAPVTQTVSKREIHDLLHRFAEVRAEKRYLFGAGWKPLSDWVPVAVNDALGRALGWHWMIEARKGDQPRPA